MIANELMKQGIDINDEKSVEEFINQINANGGIDSLRDDNVPDPSSNVISLDSAKKKKSKK